MKFPYLFINLKRTIPNPCLNNGTCENGVNDYKCTCMNGFVGKTCDCKLKNIKLQYLYRFVRFTCTYHLNGFQISVDDCYPNPCLNGGTCIDGVNDYNCLCVSLFVGKNCSSFKSFQTKSFNIHLSEFAKRYLQEFFSNILILIFPTFWLNFLDFFLATWSKVFRKESLSVILWSNKYHYWQSRPRPISYCISLHLVIRVKHWSRARDGKVSILRALFRVTSAESRF